ncbi:hypothetical protein FHX82_003495 [Amycolatopsis bartoniae]|uniref:LppX_LprAFG lipoprotein n=1 Tax=Amycolatopsis bartoniae TaxID=941986 RepID=A0A8H9IV47_9PSEU|nr:hypothetical protein [Amycolatopsis bartoniae]MBB2936431.1 hypothetical protein [Amycolatopsis bartoniae]TVT11081.1 hypothetical protein FNH07_03580 [Amycolatopsis bartoniae]GHF68996.1 hypothetical protein GCM10017566_48590 [Amycolatopsis bartoniae]
MRTALGAAAGAALVAAGLAVSACSSNGNSTTTAAQEQPASPGQVVAAAYTKTTDAKTAKTAMTTQITAAGQTVPVSASGVIDFAGNTAQLTETLPNGAGNAEARFLNGVVYQQLPANLGAALSGGKPWISIDANKLAQQQYGASLSDLQGLNVSDPSDALGYLRGAGDQVREIGPDTVDGTPTKHYDVTLDLDKAAAGRSPQAQQATQRLEQQLGSHTLPAQVWVDDQGRLRKLVMDEKITPQTTAAQNGASTGPVTVSITETFSDFGTPVTVTAPPADQVADVTDRVLQAQGQTGGR